MTVKRDVNNYNAVKIYHGKGAQVIPNNGVEQVERIKTARAAVNKYHQTSWTQGDNRLHRCCICGSGYSCDKDLLRHVKVHIRRNRFECLLCALPFLTLAKLKVHRRSQVHALKKRGQMGAKDKPKRGQKRFRKACKFCGQVFRVLVKYKEHMIEHYNAVPAPSQDLNPMILPDSTCPDKFVTTEELRTRQVGQQFASAICRQASTNSSNALRCSICNLLVADMDDLYDHFRDHSPIPVGNNWEANIETFPIGSPQPGIGVSY